jgi:uncharacterized membrane protein YcaP (DUF421 family)
VTVPVREFNLKFVAAWFWLARHQHVHALRDRKPVGVPDNGFLVSVVTPSSDAGGRKRLGAVLRAVFGYCFLVFVVRTVGRRPGKQLTPFEFVLVFFMGGVTLTSMVGDDRSLSNALCQITAVALMHSIFAILRERYAWFSRFIDGTPLLLLGKGEWQIETMKRMRIQDDDVMAMARDQGLETLDQIEYAVLERNGEISIIPAPENS